MSAERIAKEMKMESKSLVREPWFRYGVGFLFFEMAMAVAVSAYSLYMTFHGLGGFPGKH
jgi:hypothetical protein